MNQSKIACCGLCWSEKRKCQRANTGCCRFCTHYLRERKLYNQCSVKHSALLYLPDIFEQLFKYAPIGSLLSLDATGGDSYTLSLHITSSTGPIVEFSQQISGPYQTHNLAVLLGLDGLGRMFSADLNSKDGDSQLVSKAALAGGLMHLLCSSVSLTEAVNTSRDGREVENEYTSYNIATNFNYILIFRLQEIFLEILKALRSEDQGLDLPYSRSDAYAAAVILRCEMEYFRNSIKNGHLRKHISHGACSLLFNWFTSIECEFEDRLRLGCVRFTSWQASSVEGCMRSLRRNGETLDIDMHLQLNQYTRQGSPGLFFTPCPYNSIGHGRDTLVREAFISRPNSAMGIASQYLTLAEPMPCTWDMRKLPDIQVPSFSGMEPAWENPADSLKPDFRLLVNEQETINPTIDPRHLLLGGSTLGNQRFTRL